MAKLRWDKAKSPKSKEPAFPKPKQKAKGGWTHLPRQPVKVFTKEELEQYRKDHGL